MAIGAGSNKENTPSSTLLTSVKASETSGITLQPKVTIFSLFCAIINISTCQVLVQKAPLSDQHQTKADMSTKHTQSTTAIQPSTATKPPPSAASGNTAQSEDKQRKR